MDAFAGISIHVPVNVGTPVRLPSYRWAAARTLRRLADVDVECCTEPDAQTIVLQSVLDGRVIAENQTRYERDLHSL